MCKQTHKLMSWAHPFIAFMKRSIIRDPVDERYPHAIFRQLYLNNSHEHLGSTKELISTKRVGMTDSYHLFVRIGSSKICRS